MQINLCNGRWRSFIKLNVEGRIAMRVFLMSATSAIVLAIASMLILDQAVQRNADQAFGSSSSVRLPDHGNIHNLVGRDWYSAKEHGWDNEIPTANSPLSNAPPLASK
jgi:hypothetical protein